MNPNNQFFDFASQSNQSNLAEGSTASQMNVPHASIHSPNQCYDSPDVYTIQFPQPQQAFQLTSVNTTVYSPIVQNNFVVDLPTQPIAFFYQPPNDFCNYRILCNEISFGTAIQLLNEFNGNGPNINYNQNEYTFFYQQYDSRIYRVTCEIVSPSLIINFLNRTVYGIEFEQNVVQEQLTFTFEHLNRKKISNFI